MRKTACIALSLLIIVCTMMPSYAANNGGQRQQAADAGSQLEEPITGQTGVSDGTELATAALVQSYEPAKGNFVLKPEARFFVIGTEEPDGEVAETLRLMAGELAAEGVPCASPLELAFGREKRVRPGDIVIRLCNSEEFSCDIETADINESYILTIGDCITLEACDCDGLYYGLLTLLQMAMEESAQGLSESDAGIYESKADTADSDAAEGIKLPCCRICDGPDVAERTVFLDCGRKYFSPEWIENFIKRSSFQRFNNVQLHFTENFGVRVDSEAFPWLTSEHKTLSREEMTEIVETARRYRMDVIPSIDTPGHNLYMIEKYEDYVSRHPKWSFTYDGKTYDKKTKGFGTIANYYSFNGATKKVNYVGLDITKAHARAFVDALIDDYADFFAELGCTKFAIGGDEAFGWNVVNVGGADFDYGNRWNAFQHWEEYARKELKIRNGSSSDAFVSYMNSIAERLEGKGYTCRMFNDEVDINNNQHVELKQSIEIQFWSPSAGNYQKLVREGHTIYADIPKWSYYVSSHPNGKDIMKGKYKAVNAGNIYLNWKPGIIQIPGKYATVPEDQFGGSYFNIWCDDASYKNEATIWQETIMRSWASGTRMWNREINSDEENLKLSFKEFAAWAKAMNCYPGFCGDSGKTSVLPECGDFTHDMNWTDKLLSIFGK